MTHTVNSQLSCTWLLRTPRYQSSFSNWPTMKFTEITEQKSNLSLLRTSCKLNSSDVGYELKHHSILTSPRRQPQNHHSFYNFLIFESSRATALLCCKLNGSRVLKYVVIGLQTFFNLGLFLQSRLLLWADVLLKRHLFILDFQQQLRLLVHAHGRLKYLLVKLQVSQNLPYSLVLFFDSFDFCFFLFEYVVELLIEGDFDSINGVLV